MSITLTILDRLGLSKTAAKVILALSLVLGLTASHTAVYFYGKHVQETETLNQGIEIVQGAHVQNAEDIERQTNQLNEAARRLERASANVNKAIDENSTTNLNPSCSSSDAEFMYFNEAIGEANRDLPRGGSD